MRSVYFLLGAVRAFAPYPAPARPLGTLPLRVVSHEGLSSADKTTLETLSGLLARDTPQVYVVDHDGALDPTDPDAYDLWLEQLREVYGAKTDTTFLHDFPGLIESYAGASGPIEGYVVYNETDGSTNAAFTYCASYAGAGGVGGVLAAASPATIALLDTLHVAQLRDFSGTLEGPLVDEVQRGGAVFPANFSFRMDTTSFSLRSATEQLVAYSIFARVPTIEFTCSDGSDQAAQKACLKRFPDGGPVDQARLAAMSESMGGTTGKAMGWGPEGSYVTTLLKRGIVVHASDHAFDLPPLRDLHTHSAVRHDEVASPFRQPRVNATKVAAFVHDARSARMLGATALKNASATRGTHTVAFMMTDGDNVCWLLNGFATDKRWFASDDRGKVPLGWTFTPAAVDLMPAVLGYVYEQATANDSFVTAPSGVGYTYADLGFNATSDARNKDYAAATGAYMKRANQTIINFIDSPSRDIGGPGETPNFDPDQSAFPAMMAEDAVDAALWYSFGKCYAGAEGDVWWSQGKPVVGGRIALWGPDQDASKPFQCTQCGVECVQRELMKMKLQGDPSYASAYTLIPVHVWDQNVSNVLQLAMALEAIDDPEQPKFEVVTPAELIHRLVAAVGPPDVSCPVPRGSYHASCRSCAVGGGGKGSMDCTLRCSCNAGGSDPWQQTACDLRTCADLAYEANGKGSGHFTCGGKVCSG